MKLKRLTMDIDFHDLTYIGKGSKADLEKLFDQMAEAGFDAAIMDCFWCGKAMYHSSLLPVFQNKAGWASAPQLAEVLQQWDPLAYAIELANQHGIKLLAYFRLLEEAYAPFDGHKFFRENPQYWWQSRCGMYRMVGWPCYNYPEVREHMLQRADDLRDHGVDGFLFGLSRSHIPYFNPYVQGRDGETFGYNPPVVEEFKRRYGVDLSSFEHIEEVASAKHNDLSFTYEYRWVGTEDYDMWAFRKLLGEGFDAFLRSVRQRHPDAYICIECGDLEAGGQPDDPPERAVFRIDLEGLCAEQVLDEYFQSRNYRQEEDFVDVLLPRYQHVKDSSRQLSAWLNDFFSPTGGEQERFSVSDVADYVDKVLDSTIDGALIHEAAFLYETEAPDQMWQQIARLK